MKSLLMLMEALSSLVILDFWAIIGFQVLWSACPVKCLRKYEDVQIMALKSWHWIACPPPSVTDLRTRLSSSSTDLQCNVIVSSSSTHTVCTPLYCKLYAWLNILLWSRFKQFRETHKKQVVTKIQRSTSGNIFCRVYSVQCTLRLGVKT